MRLSTPGKRCKLGFWAVAATCAVVGTLAGAARSATTTFNDSRTIQFHGRAPFPIVLSPAPPPGSTTPWGANGLAETAAAGVNMYRTGIGGVWSDSDIQTALA